MNSTMKWTLKMHAKGNGPDREKQILQDCKLYKVL